MSPADQVAPGSLENVRLLLNTWLIPNDTRSPEDRFDAYADEHGLATPERTTLRRVRDDLRRAVEGAADAYEILNDWIGRLDVRPHLTHGELTFRHGGGLTGDSSGDPAGDSAGDSAGDMAGEMVAACVAAVADGRWRRLKACPDCRWVFYDHSRNASKRWCLMTAGGPDGRSCGSIAKVRAYRERAHQRA